MSDKPVSEAAKKLAETLMRHWGSSPCECDKSGYTAEDHIQAALDAAEQHMLDDLLSSADRLGDLIRALQPEPLPEAESDYTVDSPNFAPKELEEFAARGYERINRDSEPPKPPDHDFVPPTSGADYCAHTKLRVSGGGCGLPESAHRAKEEA